jgi:biopolymer transport protein ExbD
MRRLLLLIALVSCSRKTEAQKAPEEARLLPEGFTEPSGRGDDAIPDGVTLFVGPRVVSNEPRGPALVAIGKDGFEADVKENALMVKPLSKWFESNRNGRTTLIVHADAHTTYRTLVEVLFTAGQSGFERHAFVVRRAGGSEGALIIAAPKPGKFAGLAKLGDPSSPPSQQFDPCAGQELNPAVIAVKDGWSIKGAGANLAPGCNEPGAGLAVARSEGVTAVTACLEKLKAASKCYATERSITISANADIEFQDMVRLWDAVRKSKAGADLFPEIMLGVMR